MTSLPTDDVLLARARRGDRTAVAELYDRHHRVALRAATAYAHYDYPAEDLVADAFTALLRALDGGGGPRSSVGGYLMASMRNAAASRARRRGHRHTRCYGTSPGASWRLRSTGCRPPGGRSWS
jgi:DNA-directed RNA polymerase specialized sigma24 family protein